MPESKIDWKNHLVGLLVVFLGVTIAFMLDNWRENRHNRQLEQEYLQSFKVDLRADHAALDSILLIQKESLEKISRLLENLQMGKLQPDSILILLSSLLTYQPFFPKISTYESMKNSGNLNLISDFELQQDLIRYYHRFEEKKMLEDIYFGFYNSYFIPFLMKNISTRSQNFVDPGVVRSVEFHNLVAGARQALWQINAFFVEVSRLNDGLLSRLESGVN